MNITFNMNHNPKTIVKVIVVDSCRVVGTYFVAPVFPCVGEESLSLVVVLAAFVCVF